MKIMQNLFNKKNDILIETPMKGRLINIKEVNDATFSRELLGKGVAVIPNEKCVYAPADGTVTTIFPTGHAIAITTDHGVEILIHVGLDTVKLNGKCFKSYVEKDQRVEKGELLIEADIEQIKVEGYDTVTLVIICNSEEFVELETEESKDITLGDVIIKLKK